MLQLSWRQRRAAESMSVWGASLAGRRRHLRGRGSRQVRGCGRRGGGKCARATPARPRATVCSREPWPASRPDHAAVSCPMVSTRTTRQQHCHPLTTPPAPHLSTITQPPLTLFSHHSIILTYFFYYLFTLRKGISKKIITKKIALVSCNV